MVNLNTLHPNINKIYITQIVNKDVLYIIEEIVKNDSYSTVKTLNNLHDNALIDINSSCGKNHRKIIIPTFRVFIIKLNDRDLFRK